jgi:hypothetical protein
MHKCCCDEDTGSKMGDEKKECRWDMHSRESSCEDGECARNARSGQDDEEGRNVQRQVVCPAGTSLGTT